MGPLVRRRVTQTGQGIRRGLSELAHLQRVHSFCERVPQPPGLSSNTGDAQARLTRGGLLFGYFSLGRARESNQLPVCHRRPWIPAYAGMTGARKVSSPGLPPGNSFARNLRLADNARPDLHLFLDVG